VEKIRLEKSHAAFEGLERGKVTCRLVLTP